LGRAYEAPMDSGDTDRITEILYEVGSKLNG
jgi:hypothetical protein